MGARQWPCPEIRPVRRRRPTRRFFPRPAGKAGRGIASEFAASEASLVFVSDEQPGIRRRKAGSGFSYRAPNGKRISDRRVLDRIKSLAVPPAWTDIWISADPRGHLQATGRDAKNRKQ